MPVFTLAIAPAVEDVFGVGVHFEAASTGARLGGELGRTSGERLTGTADRQLVETTFQAPQRNPAISPRRIPVVAVRRNAGYRRCPLAVFRKVVSSLAVHVSGPRRGRACGRCVRSASLVLVSPCSVVG